MLISLSVIAIYTYLGKMWTAIFIAIVVAYYLYMRRENNYFPNKGIKSLKTYLPCVGNTLGVLLQREHFMEYTKRLYKNFPGEKYFGFRHFNNNFVLIKDLELIKQIGIKDFDHFMDHVGQINQDADPLFGSNLMALEGQKWRDMRATLSPAFTSSKMRGMFQFISECSEQLATFFKNEYEKPENKDKKYVDVDLKDTFTRYTSDIIATSAFGVQVDSLKDRDNKFYLMGRKSTNFDGLQTMKFFLFMIVPKIMKFFNLTVLSAESNNFFRDLVVNSIKAREEQGIIRPDVIHLLMEARKGALNNNDSQHESKDVGFATVEEADLGHTSKNRSWSDDEIAAQAFIFFLAGFETSANLLCFLSYELARNPEIQKKLQEEIVDVAERNNGKIKYEDLPKMKYLDMVVSETLRYWVPAVATDRKCVKPYTLPPSTRAGKEGKLNVGDGVLFPICAIHHDPQYYKNPEKFDPERFSDENKHEINPLAYMPFGVGPRNCIGSRFALMEVKSIVFHLMLNFDLIVTNKTMIPFKFNRGSFNMLPKEGLWIGITPRKGN